MWVTRDIYGKKQNNLKSNTRCQFYPIPVNTEATHKPVSSFERFCFAALLMRTSSKTQNKKRPSNSDISVTTNGFISSDRILRHSLRLKNSVEKLNYLFFLFYAVFVSSYSNISHAYLCCVECWRQFSI